MWSSPGLSLRKLEEEGVGRFVPPPPDLNSSNQELASPTLRKLPVLPELAAAGNPKGRSIMSVSSIDGLAIRAHRGHYGRIDGNLGTVVHRKAIGYDLDAPTVLSSCTRQVEVPNKHVCLNPSPTFPAHPGPHALDRATPLDKSASPAARGAVITKRVQSLSA